MKKNHLKEPGLWRHGALFMCKGNHMKDHCLSSFISLDPLHSAAGMHFYSFGSPLLVGKRWQKRNLNELLSIGHSIVWPIVWSVQLYKSSHEWKILHSKTLTVSLSLSNMKIPYTKLS